MISSRSTYFFINKNKLRLDKIKWFLYDKHIMLGTSGKFTFLCYPDYKLSPNFSIKKWQYNENYTYKTILVDNNRIDFTKYREINNF